MILLNRLKRWDPIKSIKYWIWVFIQKKLPFIRKRYQDEFLSEVLKELPDSVSIVNPLQTLTEIQNAILEKKIGAYMRFGDGDAFLANSENDMLQIASGAISAEMKEAFLLKGEFIFKSLSIHSQLYGYEKQMYFGNHLVSDEFANKLLRTTFHCFIGHKIYSPISLHFAATYFPSIANSFLKVLKSNCLIFIGNENVSPLIVKKLFGNAIHVKTPSINSYDAIDIVETEANLILSKCNGFGVVVVAMGCSGRPLMKRLFQKKYNVFLFDFGSLLDGICGNKTRSWLKTENLDFDTLLNGLE